MKEPTKRVQDREIPLVEGAPSCAGGGDRAGTRPPCPHRPWRKLNQSLYCTVVWLPKPTDSSMKLKGWHRSRARLDSSSYLAEEGQPCRCKPDDQLPLDENPGSACAAMNRHHHHEWIERAGDPRQKSNVDSDKLTARGDSTSRRLWGVTITITITMTMTITTAMGDEDHGGISGHKMSFSPTAELILA